MCGLFGWQTLGGPMPSELAAVLAYTMDCRGGDSFGYWALPVDRKDPALFHGLGECTNSVRAHDLAQARTLVAHTRYATTGTVSLENAHPLKVGRLIGAHNGIVSNWSVMNSRYGRKYAVDSSHIFAHLGEKLPLVELSGYGAITYVSKDKPGEVRLGKFNGGELAVARLVGGGIVWASTQEALEGALRLAGLGYELLEVERNTEYRVNRGRMTRLGPLEIGPMTPVSEALTSWKPPLSSEGMAYSKSKEGMKCDVCDAGIYTAVQVDGLWVCYDCEMGLQAPTKAVYE